MTQKAVFDFEAEESASPVRRVFGKIFFILSFIFLLTSLIWYVSPLTVEFLSSERDKGHDADGNYIVYIEENDDPINGYGEGAAEAYTKWEAEHSVKMYLKSEPVWGGIAAFVLAIGSMVLSFALTYRPRLAFKSTTTGKTVARYTMFGVVILFMVGIGAFTTTLLSTSIGKNESIPVYWILLFGFIFGLIVGFSWWIQAKLSGRCIKSGYRYDAGYRTGGDRIKAPSLFWVDKGEYMVDVNPDSRQRYQVADPSEWIEEDRQQYQRACQDEFASWWIATHA